MFVFVLSESLIDGDTLELRFTLGLFQLDLLVLGEMLNVLGVVVRLVRLRFWRRVIQFCR